MTIITIVLFILGSYAAVWILWILYIAVMNMKKNLPNMGIVAKCHAYPTVYAAVLLDAAVNLTIGTVLFLDPPQEWLLTARLKRYHMDESAGWRYRMSDWICSHLLDQFDPSGDHC